MKLSPLIKGLITGIVLLGLTLVYFYSKVPSNSPLQYVLYLVYAAGIAWTVIAYSRSEKYTGKFGDIFGQGFRCFIIITLLMTVFGGTFTTLHPEFAEQDAKLYKEYLDKEEKDKTPQEKDEMVANYKKYYTTRVVQGSIFGYLIPGVVFTLAGAGLLILKKKNP